MVIFLQSKSDIETFGFSDIIFAYKTREANITCRKTNITAKQYHSPKANITEKPTCFDKSVFLVGEGGFGPPKRNATDLQSAPFGHSGTLPKNGAGDGTRTRDLLITNQLLYQLSYTSTFVVLSRTQIVF